ncbi:phospho-N-acetylmuramoyl-pentapeptide-transferase [bacterium]|nr:phospho-N-acetylmuramoyl-pentapeptide-transferase [bacterium]
MFYHFLYPLQVYFSPFNVFQYITFRASGAIITSLVVSFFLAPRMIKTFKRLHIGQHIRPEGPPTHLSKAGTPTMGGIIILLVLLISTFLWAKLTNPFIILCIISIVWLGLLGFLDDYLKVVKKHTKGLRALYKVGGQLILAFFLVTYIYFYPPNADFVTKVNIPFMKDLFLDLGIFYFVLVLFIIVGASNAVNLTDGLDGLAIGSIVFAALTYAIFAYFAGHLKFSMYLRIIPVSDSGELVVLLAAMVGAGLGFLWFNTYPAEIFMGDTGSLFLGGTIGVVAILVKQELLLIIVGGIFVVEAVSVILQVISFKIRGKRIFKMAPLHHHFELLGWAEPKVVIRFWVIAIVLSLVSLASLKLR